jgi:hypothetical protein
MRRIRETLRLHLQAGLSYNEVARALKISKSVVGKYVLLARVAGVDWDTAQTLSDEDLEARLYRPAVPRASYQLTPDFALIHQELKRAGVTLMLLWEEYATGNSLAYKYTSFCIKYREFALRQQRSMRQIHIAGEKLFIESWIRSICVASEIRRTYSSTPREGLYAKARFALAVWSDLLRVAVAFATAVTDADNFGVAPAQPVSAEVLTFTLRARSGGVVMRHHRDATSSCRSSR